MSHFDYDVLTIGLGPAGMAVSVMASEMGLKVCAIESRKIGGECMNVGCIPSKALLRISEHRHAVNRFAEMQLGSVDAPDILQPFEKIATDLKFINDAKTTKMFHKVDLVLAQGKAAFVDAHTVVVDNKPYSAKRIFIATGTEPAVPPIPGLSDVDILTNNNLFQLEKIPASLLILGGGAIGCEMAQAFQRLGCQVTIVHMDPHLIPIGDPEAAQLLEKHFIQENILVLNGRKIESITKTSSGVLLKTAEGESIEAERILVAAGRKVDLNTLQLDKAGVQFNKRGIEVDKCLRTSQKHIFAVGDCNGYAQLSHAAMHQGMIALMNAMMPGPMKMNFRNFSIPWTVFTDPEVSYVGMTEKQLNAKGIRYETIQVRYDDYGAAIAENVAYGFIKVFASKTGRIYGVSIVGRGSGEMINEWALAIQYKLRLHQIMMQQHSFPTMGFLSKRVAETWMMKRMQSPWLRRIAGWMYRLGK
jgi:pyruvate/2-oxoglutarate dehydrogenase complex dihydrolipoamide dehydrogenase (E3) component